MVLGTTSTETTTQTNTTTKMTTSGEVGQPPAPMCSSCHISFHDRQEHRIHMKEPWQYVKQHAVEARIQGLISSSVYNLKRRIASLPPITPQAFDVILEKAKDVETIDSSQRASNCSDSERDTTTEEAQTTEISEFQCLFCSKEFANDFTGFETNLEHMSTSHGFSIPDAETVTDLQIFVGYLATEVRLWHECLYCGAEKPSVQSVQSHMRDKRHCSLNFEREPELLDFWDDARKFEDDECENMHLGQMRQDGLIHLTPSELQLPSGKVIGTRQTAPTMRKSAQKQRLALATTTDSPSDFESKAISSPLPSTTQPPRRQLARREEMSMLGIPEHQRRALIMVEKKAQRTEAVARRAREWIYARNSNSQKFDQLDNQMKMGKQNHKLLPR